MVAVWPQENVVMVAMVWGYEGVVEEEECLDVDLVARLRLRVRLRLSAFWRLVTGCEGILCSLVMGARMWT